MKLIVGLGNPGKEYSQTRHNVGFMVLDVLAEELSFAFDKEKFNGLYGEAVINSEKVLFLKPQKYINLSGEVINSFLNYFKIKKEDMLIIHDDLDLPVGKYRLKYQGRSAGHNGLKNIELMLQSKVYNRLKIGISNNKDMETRDYVLGRFSREEKKELDQVILTAKDIAKSFIESDMEQAVNQYNRR